MDRRTKYTQMIIKESLYQLLSKKHLSQITIKELCQLADINRATFYRNYADIYDLYEKIEEGLVNEAFSTGNIQEERYTLLQLIYDNQEFYKEFFYSRLESTFIKKTIEQMYLQVKEVVKDKTCLDERSLQISYMYSVHGVIGVLENWVNAGCPEKPKEFGDIIYGIVEKQYQR